MVIVKERRTRVRHARAGKVHIFWQDGGVQRQATAQLRDLSVQGFSCLIPQRLAFGTSVRVECSAEHLHGDAIVRHCAPKGINYIIGVEFRGALEWRGSGEAVRARGWD